MKHFKNKWTDSFQRAEHTGLGISIPDSTAQTHKLPVLGLTFQGPRTRTGVQPGSLRRISSATCDQLNLQFPSPASHSSTRTACETRQSVSRVVLPGRGRKGKHGKAQRLVSTAQTSVLKNTSCFYRPHVMAGSLAGVCFDQSAEKT